MPLYTSGGSEALYGRWKRDSAGRGAKWLRTGGMRFRKWRDCVDGGGDLGRDLGGEGGTEASRRQTGLV